MTDPKAQARPHEEQDSAPIAPAPLRRWSAPPALGITSADACRAELLAALAEAACVEIDASRVTTIDAAGVQVLIAARRSAERAGKVLKLSTPAQGTLEAALVAAGVELEGATADLFWRGEVEGLPR